MTISDSFPCGPGIFRRLIDISAKCDTAVTAWVEDDFHHFGLTITHNDYIVTDVSAHTERAPWSTCAAAGLPLRVLTGKPLIQRASDVGRYIDMRLQCTHLFDLAGLALAHASHRRTHRRYEAVVRDVPRHGAAQALLSRDGEVALAWHVSDATISDPPSHAGRSLSRGFRAWTETMPEEEAEQAFVLRRAIMVAGGRKVDLDRFDNAADTGMPPVCHTYQPENLPSAMRNKGSTRNFEGGAADMLTALKVKP